MPAGETHRKDIDGLRAIAVISVVLYHAGTPGFSGGFIGVDIFFVLSGYLITRVMLADRAARPVSIAAFYERRIRRIMPALFVMLAFCSAAALAMLIPSDLRSYSADLASTVAFLSNIRFWLQGGYFDSPALIKPLFHTWSLAVEEQFYIVYPLLLALVLRRWPGRLASIVLLLCFASFAASAVMALVWNRAAFFLPWSRAWELLAGCYLAMDRLPQASDARTNEAFSLAGAGCIALALFGYSPDTPFPGLAALLPCGGTLLLLHANSAQTTRTGMWLGSAPLAFVGLISYSLYLWHWPLLTFWRLGVQRDPSIGETAFLLAVTLAVAALSWRFVERPFRRGSRLGRRPLFALFGAGTAAFFALGCAGYFSNGWPQRLSAPAARMLQYVDYSFTPEFARANAMGQCFLWDPFPAPYRADRCFTSKPGRRNILMWGDSLASQYSLALRETLAAGDVNLMQATYASCLPILGRSYETARNCAAFNDMVMARLDTERADAVFLAGDWFEKMPAAELLPQLDRSIALLRARGITVFLAGPTITYRERLPAILARVIMRGADPSAVNAPLAPGLLALDHVMRVRYGRMKGVVYVSILGAFCPDARCPSMADAGTPVSWSRSHVTLAGSRLIIGTLQRGPLDALVAGVR